MKKHILIVNICKEKLHYLEFVKPIEDILSSSGSKFFVKHYLEIKKSDLEKADNIIICGTSLFDNLFVDDINQFLWLKEIDKPVLGICGGMQLIGLVYNGKIKNKTEIGFYHENFKKEFLGLGGEQEVYHLHNNYVDFEKLNVFEIFSKNDSVVQAIKHKEKEIYGVLFHPEVRQKNMIVKFCNR